MYINKKIFSQIKKNINKYYYGNNTGNKKINKFILNIMDKKKYILNISILKIYL